MYVGYHNEQASYATSATPFLGIDGTNSGSVVDFSSITQATNSNIKVGFVGSFSLEWIGYLYTGTQSGNWTFSTKSDDGSYLWLGDNALQGYTVGNSLVNNCGSHMMTLVTGSTQLDAKTYYPIRVLFGNKNKGYGMIISFKSPDGDVHFDGTGFYSQTKGIE
jgi:hypothetical protein